MSLPIPSHILRSLGSTRRNSLIFGHLQLRSGDPLYILYVNMRIECTSSLCGSKKNGKITIFVARIYVFGPYWVEGRVVRDPENSKERKHRTMTSEDIQKQHRALERELARASRVSRLSLLVFVFCLLCLLLF